MFPSRQWSLWESSETISSDRSLCVGGSNSWRLPWEVAASLEREGMVGDEASLGYEASFLYALGMMHMLPDNHLKNCSSETGLEK